MPLDYQILLLPKKDYWAWLEAARDYVLKFGTNLTPEPDVAGSYMRPRQVVSFPYFKGGFPEIGDPLRWFREHYDGVRVDPIDSDDPKEFHKDLRRRIKNNDRYGAMQRPFHLVWPTNFTVITQTFGANPQIYRRYGMPGHEGVDIRALTNTDVYACADGEVYEVHLNPNDHAYGIHIRVAHRDGYKTIYAHLARALVRVGDPVKAGQTIGKADSTGNSSGAHLHLTLKQDGATARKETTYPKDVIDPTPFLVWPAAHAVAHAADPGTPRRIGINLAAASGVTPSLMQTVRRVGPSTILVGTRVPTEAIAALKNACPGMQLVARIDLAPGDIGQAAHDVARVAGDVGRLHRQGIRDFEIGYAPNTVQGGFGAGWKDGSEYARWFEQVSHRLREVFADVRLGFPGMAPGPDVSGRQVSPERFLDEAEEAVGAADWISAVSSLRGDARGDPPQATPGPEVLAAHFPGRPIWVTSADDPSEGSSAEARVMAFAKFVDSTASAPAERILFGGFRSEESSEFLSWEAAAMLAEVGSRVEASSSAPA
jgi:hypothetical protein